MIRTYLLVFHCCAHGTQSAVRCNHSYWYHLNIGTKRSKTFQVHGSILFDVFCSKKAEVRNSLENHIEISLQRSLTQNAAVMVCIVPKVNMHHQGQHWSNLK